MVFLRLEVRVFPREQVGSSPGFLRSIMKNSNEEATGPKSFAGFLLTLEKPEELTMGDLTHLIKEKWRALRPNQECVAHWMPYL